MKDFGVISLIVLGFLFLESTILSNIMILPAFPDLLLLLTVYISIHRGSIYGQTVGITSGFLLDFLSAAPLGLNAVIRTIIAFASGFFFLTLNTDGIFLPALIGFVATVLKAILLGIMGFFFPNTVFSYNLLSGSFLFELVCNSLLAPMLFYLFSRVPALTKKEISERKL